MSQAKLTSRPAKLNMHPKNITTNILKKNLVGFEMRN